MKTPAAKLRRMALCPPIKLGSPPPPAACDSAAAAEADSSAAAAEQWKRENPAWAGTLEPSDIFAPAPRRSEAEAAAAAAAARQRRNEARAARVSAQIFAPVREYTKLCVHWESEVEIDEKITVRTRKRMLLTKHKPAPMLGVIQRPQVLRVPQQPTAAERAAAKAAAKAAAEAATRAAAAAALLRKP
jgi:hypothetical protein